MPARAAFYNYARGAPRNEGDGQDAGILPQQPATAFAAQSDRHGPAPAPAEKSVGLAGSSLQMTGVAGSFLGLRQRSAFHRTAAVFAAAGDVGRCGRAAPGAGDCLTGCGCGPVLQGVHHKPPHQSRLAFRIWCRFASLIPVLQIFAKSAFPIRVTGAKK